MADEPRAPGGPATPAPAGGDQSMEDILASIRRILNEDDPGPAAAPAAPPVTESGGEAPLTLTEDMLVAEPAKPVAAPPPAEPRPAPQPVPAPGPEPIAAAARVPPPPSAPAVAPPAEAPPAAAPPVESLLAPAVAAATAASVGQLLRAVAQERSATVSRSGPSIEDVVREEIRPLLKEWLDRHLPPLVERLVRAEIERVVGRALS